MSTTAKIHSVNGSSPDLEAIVSDLASAVEMLCLVAEMAGSVSRGSPDTIDRVNLQMVRQCRDIAPQPSGAISSGSFLKPMAEPSAHAPLLRFPDVHRATCQSEYFPRLSQFADHA